MLDTLSVARELTAGGIDRDQAEVIANAMRKLARPGDHVTGDQFRAGLAEVRTEIAALDTRLSTHRPGPARRGAGLLWSGVGSCSTASRDFDRVASC